ncbi:MAG: FkbM family methyltransferase [Actinobacteria bacterium]|nr:FkbM family methyltransferase [Actinomycetota bacterium]
MSTDQRADDTFEARARTFVDDFLRAPVEQRFVLGRGEYAASIARALPIGGFVDDFTTDPAFLDVPIVRSSDLPQGALVVVASMLRPLSALASLERAPITTLDYFAFERFAGLDIKPVTFWPEFRRDYDEHRDRYDAVRARLVEPASRKVFDDLVRFRLTSDVSAAADFRYDMVNQYFEDFLELQPSGESFVDIGCYDGMTSLEFARRAPDFRHITAFEPAADNYEAVVRNLTPLGLDRVTVHQCGLSDEAAVLSQDGHRGRRGASAAREHRDHSQVPAAPGDLGLPPGPRLLEDPRARRCSGSRLRAPHAALHRRHRRDRHVLPPRRHEFVSPTSPDDMTTDRSLLITGGSHAEIPLIRAARRLGFRVITTGNRPDDLGHRHADHYAPADYSDADQVLDVAVRAGVSAIVSGCNDFAALSTARACDELGLPGHDRHDVALRIHHKDRFRELLDELGLDAPRSGVVRSAAEAVDLCTRLGYPVIVKPVDLTGGKGMTVCDAPDDVAKAVDAGLALSRQSHVVVEQFLTGSRHGFTCFVHNGRVGFWFADDEQYYLNPFLVSGTTTPTSMPDSAIADLVSAVELITSKVALVDGLVHVQCIMTPTGPQIIEVCRRCPGDLYPTFVELSTGYDYALSVVRAETGLVVGTGARHRAAPHAEARHRVLLVRPLRGHGRRHPSARRPRFRGDAMTDRPRLSVASTLYRSSGTVEEFVRRAAAAARSLVGDSFEIVLVNDGSPDDSVDRAAALLAEHPELVVVDLSRNFGHHVALLEGIAHARGELVFLIDSDLEEEPEWLSAFHDQLEVNRVDVVYGYQQERKGAPFERLSGALYWSVFRRLSGLQIPANVITCRLMTRRYVDALLQYGEREVSIGAIFAVAGFEQIGVPVVKGHKGSSTYSLRLKIWHLVNSISAFSTKPLNAIFLAGVCVSTVGFVFLLYLLIAGLFWSKSPAGWTSVMVSVWLLGGFILASLGVIAIYLGKVFTEVKARPRAIVRSIRRGSASD